MVCLFGLLIHCFRRKTCSFDLPLISGLGLFCMGLPPPHAPGFCSLLSLRLTQEVEIPKACSCYVKTTKHNFKRNSVDLIVQGKAPGNSGTTFERMSTAFARLFASGRRKTNRTSENRHPINHVTPSPLRNPSLDPPAHQTYP